MAIVVYGAGGQAKVALELLEQAGRGEGEIVGMVDDNPALVGTKVDGVAVLGGLERLAELVRECRIDSACIAVGDNALRKRWGEHARGLGLRLPVLVHPNAYVSPTATLGAGTVVMAGAVVATHALIGELCIINTGAVVDHDCQIGDCVHVAPGAVLTGGVRVGSGSLVGAGATVLPGRSIGEDAIVGAGAVVLEDVAGNATVVGNPARKITL